MKTIPLYFWTEPVDDTMCAVHCRMRTMSRGRLLGHTEFMLILVTERRSWQAYEAARERLRAKFSAFQGNVGWRRRRADPASWARVVALDQWLREPPQVIRFHGDLYLHFSRRPIEEADLTEATLPLFGGDFGHECEGMCGV